MGAKLTNRGEVIPMFNMKSGQIGEIVEWDGNWIFIGRLVFMCRDSTVQRLCSNDYWDNPDLALAARVRILQPGEQIEIT